MSTNALPADRMTAAERLDEIAGIMAAGLMRLKSRQSSSLSADLGECLVDYPADQSGHANVLKGDLA
jgi:hypothetical protein